MASGVSREKLPLIVIVGPTGSGKSSLAVRIAEKFGAEIVCADSRTIYKDMNIGTAKPTREDRARVPHWGLDLVEPGDKFTVADFKEYADKRINEIIKRRKIPILVGGSGLYIDAVVFNFQFGAKGDEDKRRQLESMSLEELHEYCNKNNILLPENHKNKRYIIRAIEQKGIRIKKSDIPRDNTIIVGIATEKENLLHRLQARTERILQDGVVEEATILGKKYGWENEAVTGNVYRLVKRYLLGELDEESLKEKNTTADWQLAKRQLTWFRRNKFIKWLSLPEAEVYLRALLAKFM